MIVKLKGFVEDLNEDSIDIDVSGVVFRVFLSMRDLGEITKEGEKIKINIHEILRDDARFFFGFIDINEKLIFEDLIKVQGVGGKVALNIISMLTVEKIVETVKNNLTTNFTQIPGIGKKVSMRLVNEMRDKIEKGRYYFDKKELDILFNQDKLNDLISCLTNLGYHPKISEEISRGLITDEKDRELEELIPIALKMIKNKL